MYTRRPKGAATELVNYQPVSSIYTKTSMVITRSGTGAIQTVVLSDGFVKKTLTFSYDGDGKISGFSTTVEDV